MSTPMGMHQNMTKFKLLGEAICESVKMKY